MGKTFNLFVRLLTRLPWRDTQCGFELFRLQTARRLFELQRLERFAHNPELCVNARRLDLRVAEVPVTWRNNADTHVTLVGSSCGWQQTSAAQRLGLPVVGRLAGTPV